MRAVTEAEACGWLGRRVSLIGLGGQVALTGLVRHVSTRNVVVLREDATGRSGIALWPLNRIARIVPAPDPIAEDPVA